MSARIDTFRRVRFDLPKGRMAGIAWGDESRPPDIVFLHATGFNAMTYRSLLAPLSERYHVLGLDARGHGRSELPAHRFGYTSWTTHRDDLIEIIERLGAPVTLAGHSMGATVSLLAAGRRPDLVRGLAMIEPVLLPPARYQALHLPFATLLMRLFSPIARGASRRRFRFANRDAAFKALKGRGFFATFPDETLRAYLEDGLIEDDHGVRLACAPAYEAATFAAQRQDPWRALARAPRPLVVLRAQKRSTCPPAIAQRIKEVRPDARIATIAGTTHALPMERPDRARAAIETAAIMATGGVYLDLV
jgi:pimeloyl-ACP methyl ester carboxylesterase